VKLFTAECAEDAEKNEVTGEAFPSGCVWRGDFVAASPHRSFLRRVREPLFCKKGVPIFSLSASSALSAVNNWISENRDAP